MCIGTYLCRRLRKECHNNQYRSAQSPPDTERAHAPDGLRSDGVDDARQDVDSPCYSRNFDARECPTRTDLGETRDVKRCAIVDL